MTGLFRPQWPRFRPRPRRIPFAVVDTFTPDLTKGVELDGSSDYWSRGALTGASDGQEWHFAALLKFDSASGTYVLLHGKSTGTFNGAVIASIEDGAFLLTLKRSSQTLPDVRVKSSTLSVGTWHAVLASGNAATGDLELYVNDASDLAESATANVTLDFTHDDWQVGALVAPSNYYDGCVSEVVFGLEYIDFPVQANRRDFFDAAGNPQPKGSDGSTPTGTQPIVYLSGGEDQFGTNFGSGGAFTKNGTPADCGVPKFIAASGVASAESFGTAALDQDQSVQPSGIAGAEAFGTAALGLNIAASGIGTAESFGTHVLNLALSATGIASGESFGSATITTGTVTISPSGIASAESIGGPTVGVAGNTITATGIATAEAFGTLTVTPGAVTVSPSGIASGEAFGTLTTGLVLLPNGIETDESFGTAIVAPGAVVITPTGVASLEAFGTVVVAGGAEAVGELIATLNAGPLLRGDVALGPLFDGRARSNRA